MYSLVAVRRSAQKNLISERSENKSLCSARSARLGGETEYARIDLNAEHIALSKCQSFWVLFLSPVCGGNTLVGPGTRQTKWKSVTVCVDYQTFHGISGALSD